MVKMTTGEYFMRMKILTIILAMFMLIQTVVAVPFNANAKTKRIPAGTKFELKLLTPIGSAPEYQGKEFQAVLMTDQTSDTDVILPMGSLVRGSIVKIVPSKRFSKGSVMYLNFDHVVTPNGRQLPISMSVVGRTELTYDGGLTASKGYGDALSQNWEKTKEIAKTATDWGNDTFEDVAGGYFRILTLPLSAIGGGIGAGAYYVYDGVADMIRKGKDIYLNKGETIKVILVDPIDVPVI